MADDIVIKTFSYKHDKLPDPSFQIIDCRSLFNPFWIVKRDDKLKDLDGSDPRIKKLIVDGDADSFEFLLQRTISLFDSGVTKFAFGCHGGKHRSVCMATAFKQFVENLSK